MSDLFYKAAGAVLAPFRYAEREAKAFKEHVKEDVQLYAATLLKIALAAVAGLLFLMFLSLTVAHAINQAMDSRVAGYAFVAGFYLIVAVIMYVLKTVDDKKKKEIEQHRKTVHA
ncbi:MAG: phage holin family protein [Cyclobacteriaceae bacterium]